MAPHTEHGSTLSVHRAFVVHLGTGGGPGRRRFSGRVEHISSGESAWFSSLEGLLAFFAAILDASTPAAPPGPYDPAGANPPSKIPRALHSPPRRGQSTTAATTAQTRRSARPHQAKGGIEAMRTIVAAAEWPSKADGEARGGRAPPARAQAPHTEGTAWGAARRYCVELALGQRRGWRLPSIQELESLTDATQSSPALPVGHPFSNVDPAVLYWSSTIARPWHGTRPSELVPWRANHPGVVAADPAASIGGSVVASGGNNRRATRASAASRTLDGSCRSPE